MTGMERAFQLLNSAGCWSDQPFDGLSLNILQQIAMISPKATYCQHHHTSMPNINWNGDTILYSLQHCGYYLIVKKLIETSEKLNFMHSSLSAVQMNENDYDERLLIKLYWDYHHSYNPIARLSSEIEREILETVKNEEHYQSTVEQDAMIKNQKLIQLVNDIYHSGDVHLKEFSEFNYFPLNQWLTDEYSLKIIWIGLLKLAESLKTTINNDTIDNIQRFKLLLNFLHYISNKHGIKKIYLEILNTVLQVQELSLNSISFPPFTQYNSIQHTTVVMNAIDFTSEHSAGERRTIFEEMKNCFENGYTYKDQCRLATSEEKNQIKFLLKSWHLNQKLHIFLMTIQNLVCSFDLVPFPNRISIASQEFVQKSIEDDNQISISSSSKQINQELLRKAEQKYFHRNTNHIVNSTIVMKTTNEHKTFPNEIFTSIDNQNNSLYEIGKFFKNQLAMSWKQLQSGEIYQRKYPSIEEIIQILESFHQESTDFWNELLESITVDHKNLFDIGLLPRTTPSTLITLFQQLWLNEKHQSTRSLHLTNDQCTLLGGIIINWIIEQQLERALHFAWYNKIEEFQKELITIPHANWIPAEHLPWLIFELEMNITIREIQVDVARHMMQPELSTDSSTLKNLVMQMNMGEGKTSVIIPMLALSLCSSATSLIRIIVLKSLFPMNYQSLRFKLGGLLNRRILPFVCRRDMNFTHEQMNHIYNRFQQALYHCDVILTSPEDLLSFDLLTIDKCRRKEFDTSRSMLIVQRWLKTFARDLLDESDEILHCKYQLIYTVGQQQRIDGGVERWQLIQIILNSVKKFAADIALNDPTNVFYKASKYQSAFPEFRFLSHRSFPELCVKIINDWLNQKSYRKTDRQCILSFVLDIHTSIDSLLDRFSLDDLQLFLVLRGLLSSEVLFICLKKRYRVNYGVNFNVNFHRLMAVPYRAKDVPADRTEFGHPDTALVLTQLSYYYSGLKDSQILQCFDRLNQEERDPEIIYTEWIAEEHENDIPQNLKQWKKVNIKECQQELHQLFQLLRYNMIVINYFLNHFVFPQEAKQFPHKLIASAWDLSSSVRTKMITGFSGTNDTQLLLPIHIQQRDLSQLQNTDAIVINNLLQVENEKYRYLPVNITSEMILNEITNSEAIIHVILDVGALFVDRTNREIAINWLKRSDKTKIDYAIYFEFDHIIVCDRQFHHHSFLTSPASERLDRCVIYLDEVHTRGTDFKFPTGFKAAVTLGNGLTKDRFVQACMRMRKLGEGHSLTFWSSDEVHRQIISLKTHSQDPIVLKDILRWVYENTQRATWDGLYHWSVQSLSYQHKVCAFQIIDWTNNQQIFADEMMDELVEKCLAPEILELKRMYGVPKALQTISQIYINQYQHANIHASEEIHHAVLERMNTYGGLKQRLSQFYDEEQQRELEQELVQEQERVQEHEQKHYEILRPCKPILHDEIKRLCDPDDSVMNFIELPKVFRRLAYAFTDSTFATMCEEENWQSNFWITTEFQRVIENKEELLDHYLRPPRWIIVYRNEHIIFVNAFEANWLMGQLQQFKGLSITTLRLFLPRIKRNQSIFVNIPTMTIPPSIPMTYDLIFFKLPIDWLVELFVFNGTIYFQTIEEQTAYCQYLSLCPKPRTANEEDAFENGWITTDGFVQELKHRSLLNIQNHARFHINPLAFVKQLLKNRNNTYPTLTSHVGNIIFNCSRTFSFE
ncbi:hypothetical protein I4U23_015291 [Adineta vaga]|nr:hypothetical protein I4U23_015291 [Adineta vaga]